MTPYFVEFTDTFGGEANYCWVDRYKVEARDMRHAVTLAKQARYFSPLPRHTTQDYGDSLRIDMNGQPVCAFVSDWDEAQHGDLNHITELP